MVKRKLEELFNDFKTLRARWREDKKNEKLKKKFRKAKNRYKTFKELQGLRKVMIEAKKKWQTSDNDKQLRRKWKQARAVFREKKQKAILLEGKSTLNGETTMTQKKKLSEQGENKNASDDDNTNEKPETQDAISRVFAANLSYSIDEDKLIEYFVNNGIKKDEIVSIMWGEDKETFEFKGYAHIDFTNVSVAKKALQLTKGKVLGRELRLEMSSVVSEQPKTFCTKVPKATPKPIANPDAIDRCFAGNLSWKIDKETLIAAFAQINLRVVHVFWVTDKETGDFYGSSFVTFESPEQAALAVAYAEKGLEILSRPVKMGLSPHKHKPNELKRSSPKLTPRPAGGTITAFLGNLSYDIDEKILKEFLKDSGEVTDVRWLTNKDTGEFKGSAFVDFSTVEAVDHAIKLNGEKLLGRVMRLDYA